MPKPAPTYVSEAALCAAFIAAVRQDDKWEIYCETGGFDILLSRRSDGCQIGIEAKLQFNLKVLSQALEEYRWNRKDGPDYRAVLVPVVSQIGVVADYLGITVITLRDGYGDRSGAPKIDIVPNLPRPNSYPYDGWHGWCPGARLKLPEYVPDVQAGVKSPLQLTEWKIRAIKIAIILETRPVTRADFQAIGMDHRRWTAAGHGWLEPTPMGWVWGTHPLDLKMDHPVNYEQIKADSAKWMPKSSLLQLSMV